MSVKKKKKQATKQDGNQAIFQSSPPPTPSITCTTILNNINIYIYIFCLAA